jgi:mono/diheme cytochrome c family protein
MMRRIVLMAASVLPLISTAATNLAPGLVVAFASGQKRHMSVAPNLALYVSSGETPSPFIPAGPFTAIWEGNINADLRGEFLFRAEAHGAFKLEINRAAVLDLQDGAVLSPAIQLKKGVNRLKATFTSPPQGDAWVRIGWTEKGTTTIPIPREALTHTPTPELETDTQLALGRELFLEFRCIKCHTEKSASAVPELAMDAPSFEGIGARRQTAWMARWILDPHAQRTSAHMPKLVRKTEEADAMAAYLASLKSGSEVVIPPSAEPSHEIKPLFEKLLCASCHTPPEIAEAATNKIALRQIAAKFASGKLAEFLRMPEAHYAWIRMPNFRLTQKEAETLASELLASAPKEESSAPNATLTSKGKELVQSRGCLNCHEARLTNNFQAPSLAVLKDWTRGCLAEESSGKAPQFAFTSAERNALQAFGKEGRDSLRRHAPAEFAERQTRLLNCNACHAQPEGFPPLDLLGSKLRPEWSAAFIGGRIAYKPRAETHPKGEVWLEARMPAFKSLATNLAEGLAAQHGFPPRTPPNPAPDPELVKIGQKLVGKDGGFSCVSCHGVAAVGAADVFESEGINLAHAAERLQLEFYRRWVRNPLSVDLQTKMPVYFEEGRSPLNEILDGDAEKQITAIWHYLLLGPKMPPPNLGEAQ